MGAPHNSLPETEEATENHRTIERARHFNMMHCERVRHSGHKMKREFQTGYRKSISLMRTVQQWDRLPRKAVHSSSQEFFKID